MLSVYRGYVAETECDRPGLHEFLSSVATKYEMHVYTMGTRAYAEEVCAAIDPDGKFFGGRLLSRDESGSTYLSNLVMLVSRSRMLIWLS